MVDVDRILKNAVNKATVTIGSKQTKSSISKGAAKLVVIAKNCPQFSEIIKLAEGKKVPVHQYSSTSVNLGYACGKKFPVSTFAVVDEGESNIIQLLKKRK